jgi:hypothetical protein
VSAVCPPDAVRNTTHVCRPPPSGAGLCAAPTRCDGQQVCFHLRCNVLLMNCCFFLYSRCVHLLVLEVLDCHRAVFVAKQKDCVMLKRNVMAIGLLCRVFVDCAKLCGCCCCSVATNVRQIRLNRHRWFVDRRQASAIKQSIVPAQHQHVCRQHKLVVVNPKLYQQP